MSTSGTISKCVTLARGLGTRMRRNDPDARLEAEQAEAADTGVKAMVPVGRPFLDYVLSALADAGFQQVCLVIGPEHDAIREYYTRTLHPTRLQISFAIQPKPVGTANAVLAAEDFAAADEFLAINSDNYYPLDALLAVQRLGQPGTVLFESAALVRNGNISEDRIRTFADCVVDKNGFLAEVIEKPDATTAAALPHEKLVSMNCWRFGPAIFAACRDVRQSPRGEFELPDAVKLSIQRGERFKVARSRSGVLDLSRRSDIAVVAARLENVQAQL